MSSNDLIPTDSPSPPRNQETGARTGRRVYDCTIYNGEIDLLELRLEELDRVVDVFVVVEAGKTFTGKRKAQTLLDDWDRVSRFAHKMRYVGLRGFGGASGPWERETFQRNSCLRGLLDAEPNDLVLLSDVDEIPRAEFVELARDDLGHEAFGFRQSFRYFAMNYCNVQGPESAAVWSVGFTAQIARRMTPEQVRYAVRDGTLASRIFDEGGWHFSYLGDLDGAKRKVRSFSHQEYNNPEFLDNLDLARLVSERKDLLGREGFVWEVLDHTTDLPEYVQRHPEKYSRYLVGRNDTLKSLRSQFGQRTLTARVKAKLARSRTHQVSPAVPEPVIICPYLNPEDRQRVEEAFGLNEDRGKRLPFYFWQDTERIGPEAAFQHCWGQFPNRDVIIIHTDMAPIPEDQTNAWYDDLLRASRKLRDAGAIACDLVFARPDPVHPYTVQCGGGTFPDGLISHICQVAHDDSFAKIRPVEWVTFGGVYLRRAALDMCGPFDDGYKWAYVKDVDYSLEMRKRGWNLYQIPTTLIHEESRSTRSFLDQPEYRQKVTENYEYFYEKWAGWIKEDQMVGVAERFQNG